MEQDDLPSRQEILLAGLVKSEAVIVDARDAHLRQVITAYHREHAAERRIVGVLWGAGHMRAVTRVLLRELGYRVAGAEWVTVLTF